MRFHRLKLTIRIIAFCGVLGGLLYGLSSLLSPVWYIWNNEDTLSGFYEEPKDTLDTVFLGSSTTTFGIVPTVLYEDYGICAYNLGTADQPVMMSYYWLRETWNYHEETLQTVVLETSALRYEETESSFYQRALVKMKLSENKLSCIRALADDNLDSFSSLLIPLISFHDRWKSLEEADFSVYRYELHAGLRGWEEDTTILAVETDYDEADVPAYLLTSDESAELNEESLYYLDKIAAFCEENDLNLILMRTPTGEDDWSDAEHNAVQAAADEYGLTFLDFNYSPYVDEIGYDGLADRLDSRHLNYNGAFKLTAWIGQYLTENCNAADVRGTEKYAYMEEVLEEYDRLTLVTELQEETDVAKYIEAVNAYDDFTILISVKGDAVSALDAAQTDRLAVLGLTGISELDETGSYLAVIEDGTVVYEAWENAPAGDNSGSADIGSGESGGEEDSVSGKSGGEESGSEDSSGEDADGSGDDADNGKDSTGEEDGESEQPLSYQGTCSDGTSYTLISGGLYAGDVSSIIIDGEEESANEDGFNIVVYDTKYSEVTDSTCFDTGVSVLRTKANAVSAYEDALLAGTDFSDLDATSKNLYLYDERCADDRKVKQLKAENADVDLLTYLDTFLSDDGNNYLVILASQGDLQSFTADEKTALIGLGLSGLANLASGSAYAAVIDGGEVYAEETAGENSRAKINVLDYVKAYGAGAGADNSASIVVDGKQRALKADGLNVVIYNKATELLADAAVFDAQGNVIVEAEENADEE